MTLRKMTSTKPFSIIVFVFCANRFFAKYLLRRIRLFLAISFLTFQPALHFACPSQVSEDRNSISLPIMSFETTPEEAEETTAI